MKVVLGFGSNLGNRKELILNAMSLLEKELGKLILSSSLIESEPWGFESENMFLNSAAVFETNLSPEETLIVCNKIEKELGRIRTENKEGYQSRTIDIDILLIDNLIINSPTLKIPHPFISYRDFVLNPLKEIIPDWIHPLFNQKIKDLNLQTPSSKP